VIFHPKPGQRVQLRYRRGGPRRLARLHGCTGIVCRAAMGPGPINAEIALDFSDEADFLTVVVPRGNLAPVHSDFRCPVSAMFNPSGHDG